MPAEAKENDWVKAEMVFPEEGGQASCDQARAAGGALPAAGDEVGGWQGAGAA